MTTDTASERAELVRKREVIQADIETLKQAHEGHVERSAWVNGPAYSRGDAERRPDEQGDPEQARDVRHPQEPGPGRPHPQRAEGRAEEQRRRSCVRAQVDAVD